MNNARLLSVATSILRNGFLGTIGILFKIFLFKSGLSKKITFQGIDMHLRNGNSDLPVFRQIFMDGQYDISVPFDPTVIVDLGANIGLFSKLMNNRYPKAQIIAVEPLPSNYKILEKNVNRIDAIRCYNKAIWNVNTELSISAEANGEWGARVSSTEPSTTKVRTITMEELIELHQLSEIDILKIDIEGAENELFSGSTQWLTRTKMIIIELHDFMAPGSSNTFIKKLSEINRFKLIVRGENLVLYNLDIAA